MALIKALWRGDISLAKTFWLFGFGVNLLLTVVFLYLNSQPAILSNALGRIFFFSLVAFYVIYGSFVLIAIWRSANKYQGLQRISILAKIMVIIGWARYLQSLGELVKIFS